MKRIGAALLFVLSMTAGAQTQGDENVAFKWAFGAVVGKDEAFVSITRDTILRSGDDVKLLVELIKPCFVYVLHEAPNGEITLLFPYSLGQFTDDYQVGKNYYIPKGRAWIEFDKSTGKEKFYTLASNERLADLENLVRSYESAAGPAKGELGKQVIAEIRDVRRKFRTFATLAEKPVTIGGNIRGVGETPASGRRPDVANIATLITASNFYSKTVTIDHR